MSTSAPSNGSDNSKAPTGGGNPICEDCNAGPYVPEEEEEVDEYDMIIDKSGCAKEHFALQDCYHDNDRKWAKCKGEMSDFRKCMSAQAAKRPVAESDSADPESDLHPHPHFMDYAPISMTDQWYGPEWNSKPVY